jgi:hypothetical protein
MKKIVLFFFIVLFWPFSGIGQEKDSIRMPDHLNVIGLNPTPMMVCNNLRNITLVYERLIKPNQSLVFQLGYLELTAALGDSLPQTTTFQRNSSSGMNASFQYRFYLQHLNTHQAPFGLYIGPYASYYGVRFKNSYSLKNSNPVLSENVTSTYSLYNLGVGLGYQFVFAGKFTLDMLVFGPSLTYFVHNKSSEGNISTKEDAVISDQLETANTRRYPLFTQFIEQYGNSSSAELTTFFRYSITIGYHF